MLALLRKDLRLSLDMLLPTGLVVAGLAVVLMAASRLPAAMAPAVLSKLTVAEVLMIVAVVVGCCAAPLAAWAVAAVVQGDGVHGAELLTASLPLRPSRATASKLTAIVIAASVPVAVMFAAAALGTLLSASPFIAFRSTMPIALLGVPAAWVGAGLALGVAPWVRGAFKVVAVALLLGVLAAAVGMLGSWASFGLFVRDYQELAGRSEGYETEIRRIFPGVAQRASWIAGATAVGIVALGAWVTGVGVMARLMSSRSSAVALVGAFVCALTGAIGVTGFAVSTDVTLRESIAAARIAAERASDVEIAAAITRWGGITGWRYQPWPRKATPSMRDDTMLRQGIERLRSMPSGNRRTNPMFIALEPIRETWARDCGPEALWLYVIDEDDRLRTAIECVLRTPSNVGVRLALFKVLTSLEQGTRFDTASVPADAAAAQRVFDRFILDALRVRLASGSGDEELLQRAIDAVAVQLRDE